MPIDAIGSSLSNGASSANSAISQEDFIRLFLAQLNFQDPLEPMDNGEFLAQLAQFSGLEQDRINGNHLENLGFINSVNQGATLLGKTVEFATETGAELGEVTTVAFSDNGASLTILLADGQIFNNIGLPQVRLIRQ